MSKWDAEYTAFVDARRSALRRTAYLLCGDWHLAEDLVQTALVKLYAAWPRLVRQGKEDAYLRQILVRTHIDERRRLWRRRESPVPQVHEPDGPGVEAREPHDDLHDAVYSLPDGQRRILILRYWLGCSVEQTAADLGISAGTVKSQTARAVQRLRDALSHAVDDEEMCGSQR